ncbi:MAG: RNA polymerase sigma factor RpoD/SigA [Candidatus Eisenbacteria bacterium]
MQPIERSGYEARLAEALLRARHAGRLAAEEVDALLGAPEFDGARFADFADAARAEGLELEGLDDAPVGDDAPAGPRLALVRGGADPSISDDPENQILNRYLADIARFPLIAREEEVALGRARRDAGPTAEWARRRLILSNLRLVVYLARRYRNRGLAYLDVIEEGNLGLITAADRFDPERGIRFATYASWWIRQAILRGVADQANAVRIPLKVLRQVKRYVAVERLLRHRLGREPLASEIAPALGLAPAQAERLGRLRHSIGGTEDIDAFDFAPEDMALEHEPPPSVETLIEWQLEHERLEAFLRRLPHREETLIRIRYGFFDGEEKTLQQTGEALGVTRERVRQIEEHALARLRAMMDEAPRAFEPERGPVPGRFQR